MKKQQSRRNVLDIKECTECRCNVQFPSNMLNLARRVVTRHASIRLELALLHALQQKDEQVPIDRRDHS